MARLAACALILFAFGAIASAEDEPPQRPPFVFDEVNTPLAEVIEKATAAKKPIFLDFFLEG